MLHWKEEHLTLLKDKNTFSELKDVALKVLHSMNQPIGQVCGPISTGGLNSREKNLDKLQKTVEKLIHNGKYIFNQMPFEIQKQKIREKSGLSKEESNLLLLETFYLPIFESGLIKTLYFVDGWESSHGSNWEHQKAKELGIEIVYIENDFLDD